MPEQQQQEAAPAAQQAIIRALARAPHKQYWAGRMPWKGGKRPDGSKRPDGEVNGIPWPNEQEVQVAVVDNPQPFDPERGVATEISHATLQEIRRDVRVQVQILGGGVADADAVIQARAAAQELETELGEAKLDLAAAHEQRAKETRRAETAEQQAAAAQQRVQELEAKLEEALAAARGRKK